MTRLNQARLTCLACLICLPWLTLSGVPTASAQSTSTVSSSPPGPRVFVAPFENARDEPRFHWLSEAAAVLLTDGLRGSGAISRTERVRAFEQLYLPVSNGLSRATIIKVGQLVGAADVVVGSYRVDGTTLSVIARSIRLDAGRLQPEVTERGELTELFAIFDRLSTRLGRGAARAGAPAPHPPLDTGPTRAVGGSE